MDTSGGALVGDVHSNGGDIDSLLSSDADVDSKMRRLQEPYERHRAHDLRAECYRRGIRPIKKGPNANDNKSGYIDLLRKYDGPNSAGNGLPPMPKRDAASTDEDNGDTDPQLVTNLTNQRKLPTMTMQTQTQNDNNGELQGFYEGAQPPLVPVLPMQYPPNLGKTSANPTTDLEILSGIANSYTQNMAADGQLCGNCRTVVTDQLMESIRLGKNKMQLQEWYKMTEQRDRDTHHLKEVLEILHELRRSYREAQTTGMNHELLVELQDDLAFFRNLKERTKERMRLAIQEARERGNKSNGTAYNAQTSTGKVVDLDTRIIISTCCRQQIKTDDPVTATYWHAEAREVQFQENDGEVISLVCEMSKAGKTASCL